MFCEFHARSAFSFLRGSSQPEELVHRAAELGYGAIAITDHGGFYGSARAHEAAKDSGIALGLAKAAKRSVPLAKATFAQYSKMVALGLGELDKSGVAELTFPGRGPEKSTPAKSRR